MGGLTRTTKGFDLKCENYEWRVQSLTEQMNLERLAIVLQEINGEISSSSGYLGTISDRSKSLFFNKQTVGQYLMALLDKNPHTSLTNTVFYRQDYLDEFERLWETQAHYHPQLTDKLKRTIRDIIIFYQRRLKSQKSLISYCEFESKEQKMVIDGKTKTITTGSRVIPRSSPLFQEFKVWQTLNNIEVFSKADHTKYILSQESKELLAEELSIHEKLKKDDILKILFENPKQYDLNYKEVEGNVVNAKFYGAFSQLLEQSGHKPLNFKQPAKTLKTQVREIFASLGWNTGVLSFDSSQPFDAQPHYKLWHLLYSFEGDNTATGDANLKRKVATLMGFDIDYAPNLTSLTFVEGYGSLSAKAIRKILPYLKEGNKYDVACLYAGYHQEAKELKEHLELLPKNSLRSPVVEKILNQMVNVINEIIDTYGRPDEVRIELARELKKNAKQREKLTKSLANATKEQEDIRQRLERV